jgi:hypothetical protein
VSYVLLIIAWIFGLVLTYVGFGMLEGKTYDCHIGKPDINIWVGILLVISIIY